MFRKKTQMVSFADDESVHFGTCHANGSLRVVTSLSLENFVKDENGLKTLPKGMDQAIHQLLVVPDYWLGNRVDTFQARKKSLIEAFVERKLKQEQPALREASDFYNYAIVKGIDQQRELFSFYLQEPVVYRLYGQMEIFGIAPRRITTPALLWQNRLIRRVAEFDEKGVGFIHLQDAVCFLYFYFKGQFLFSRTIQLPDVGEDPSEIYGQLNYEINQSFYLFSQKAKNAVDALYVSSADSQVATQLTALLGKDVMALPHFSPPTGGEKLEWVPLSCQSFSSEEMSRGDIFAISHKPLKKELYWKPVQWAAMAVGMALIALLALESVFLHSWLVSSDRQIASLHSRGEEPPAMVLQQISAAIDKIRMTLERKSGSGTAIQTLLAAPDAVSVTKLSLDFSPTTQLSIHALVHADDPDTFKTVLRSFIDRLNDSFQLHMRPLEEKDVRIFLNRARVSEKAPEYRIEIEIGFS